MDWAGFRPTLSHLLVIQINFPCWRSPAGPHPPCDRLKGPARANTSSRGLRANTSARPRTEFGVRSRCTKHTPRRGLPCRERISALRDARTAISPCAHPDTFPLGAGVTAERRSMETLTSLGRRDRGAITGGIGFGDLVLGRLMPLLGRLQNPPKRTRVTILVRHK
jgi:hypothetical protein